MKLQPHLQATSKFLTKTTALAGSFALLSFCAVMLTACQTTQTKAAEPEPVVMAPAPVNLDLSDEDAAQVFEGYLGARLAEYRGDFDTAGKMYLRAMRADVNNKIVRERAFALLLAGGDYTGAVEVARVTVAQEQAKKEADIAPLVEMLLTFDNAITGKYDGALASLSAMRANSPDLVQFELIEQYIKIAQGSATPEQAIEALKAFQPGAGLLVFKYYHLGRLYERAGNLEEAIKSYRDGQMLDPGSLFIVERLGKILESQGRVDEARGVYNGFLALNPSSMLIDTAMHRLETGQKVKLEPQKIDDDLSEVMFGLASIMMGQHINLTARQFLHLSLMAKPKHPLATFTLGLLEEQDEAFERALTYYKRVEPNTMPYLAAQVRIAEAYFQMGEKQKSIKYLEDLVAKRPDATMVKHALAQNYFDEKEFAKAVAVYSDLIADIKPPFDRPHAGLFFARGAAYERLKDYDKATANLSKALELDPQNAVILNYLGYMWIDQGKNVEQGYDYIKQAVVLRPNDGAIVDSLGWVYYKRGKFDVAVRYLEKAVSLMPNDATINMHLGDVYHKLGRLNEARVQWRRALDIGPEDPADKERLIQLMTQK